MLLILYFEKYSFTTPICSAILARHLKMHTSISQITSSEYFKNATTAVFSVRWAPYKWAIKWKGKIVPGHNSQENFHRDMCKMHLTLRNVKRNAYSNKYNLLTS